MFAPEERLIYTCPATGFKYDPLALRRAFLIERAYNDAVTKLEDQDPAVAAYAEEVIVAIGRRIFKLPPIDKVTGEGTTDSIVLAAVTAITGWLKGKELTARSSGPSAPCTDCP